MNLRLKYCSGYWWRLPVLKAKSFPARPRMGYRRCTFDGGHAIKGIIVVAIFREFHTSCTFWNRLCKFLKKITVGALYCNGYRMLFLFVSPQLHVLVQEFNVVVLVVPVLFHFYNMRQVQPETPPKNSNFSSCLQNIKLKNNTTWKLWISCSRRSQCISFFSRCFDHFICYSRIVYIGDSLGHVTNHTLVVDYLNK